ncbi:MAG: hypothetical protein H6842_07845 [Rhodospirillaceae bacterium]|nr:hypothetical protein [Rhodospirillaceae bacterium]
MARSLGHRAKGLVRDRAGGSMVLVGFATVPIVAFVGLSGDSAIGYLVKSRLGQAVDAAGLAAARETDEVARDAALDMYFDANFPENYMGSTVDGPYLTPSDDDFQLTIEATAVVPTNFMRIVGIDTMTVAARTVIERARSGMELVLVMDNTGSMCCDSDPNSKINAMKSAAQNLINILFGNNDSIENFWVGVVPYTSMVNIGDETLNRHLWLSDYHPSEYNPSDWKGCVEAREYPLDTTDDPYTVATWTPALYANHFDNYWDDQDEVLIGHMRDELGYTDGTTLPAGIASLGDFITDYLEFKLNPQSWHKFYTTDQPWQQAARLVLGYSSNATLPSTTTLRTYLASYLTPHSYGTTLPTGDTLRDLLMEAWFRRSYDGRNNNQDWRLPIIRDDYDDFNEGTGPNLGCGPPITPLTDNRNTIVAAISEMRAWHRGGTTSNLGLVWGWRVLSPRWQGLWGGDPGLPNDYFDPSQPTDDSNQPIDKVVIILTDGNNQVYDHKGNGPLSSDYTAYGRLGDGRVRQNGTGSPITSSSGARNELDRRMGEICAAMRDDGIKIITITFQQNDSATQALFSACASPRDPDDPTGDRLYYDSPTNEDLQADFEEIASELSRLRIAE